MRSLRIARCGALILLASCSQEAPPPRRASPPRAAASAPEEHHLAPVEVHWDVPGRPQPGGTLDLVANVLVRGPLPAPLEVKVTAPSGVTALRGPSRFTVPAGREGTFTEAYTFLLQRVPEGDLGLSAEAHGPSFGVSATTAYRFGRPEPTGPTVQASGPHVYLHGLDLGPTVPLQ